MNVMINIKLTKQTSVCRYELQMKVKFPLSTRVSYHGKNHSRIFTPELQAAILRTLKIVIRLI